MSGSYIFRFRILVPGQTLQKRLQDYHQNPAYIPSFKIDQAFASVLASCNKKLDSGNGDGTSMGSDVTSTHAK